MTSKLKSNLNIDILTVDIDKSQLSVNYQKSTLSNEYVQKITLAELISICDNVSDDLQYADIFKYDTYGALTLIKEDGYEISLHQLDQNHQSEITSDFAFIKITDNQLSSNNSEILLPVEFDEDLKNLIQKDYQWDCTNDKFYARYTEISNDELQEALKITDGYILCQKLMNHRNSHKFTAINKCMELMKKYGTYTYQGYLPSLYQLQLIKKCLRMLDVIMKRIDAYDTLSAVKKNYKTPPFVTSVWTSTIYPSNKEHVFTVDNAPRIVHRTSRQYIWPVFKKIK